MYSKQCYKICIRSVILGQLESFRNYEYFFPQNFRCNLTFRTLHHIFESEI